MFLIVEGVDGAGKTLASKILKERLQLHAPHSEIVNCRAPDGPIRDVLLNRPEGTIIDHQTELLLFATCHRWLLINKVLPALDRGATVILDRFTDSTISYQGGGRELGVDVVHNLLQQLVFDQFGPCIMPDYRIYVEAAEDIREARLAERGNLDHMDKQGLEFRRRNQHVMENQANWYELYPNHRFGSTKVARIENNGTLEELEQYIDSFARLLAPEIQTGNVDISHEAVSRRIEIRERLAHFRKQ